MNAIKPGTWLLAAGLLLGSPGGWGESASAESVALPVHYLNNASCPVTVLPFYHKQRAIGLSHNPYRRYENEVRNTSTKEKYLRFCTGVVLEPGSKHMDQLLPGGDGRNLDDTAAAGGALNIPAGDGVLIYAGAPEKTKEGTLADPLKGASDEDDSGSAAYSEVQETAGELLLSLWNSPLEVKATACSPVTGGEARDDKTHKELKVRVCIASRGENTDNPEQNPETLELRFSCTPQSEKSINAVISRADLLRLAGYSVSGQFPLLDSFHHCFSSHPGLAGESSTASSSSGSQAPDAEKQTMNITDVYVLIEDASRNIATNDA